MTDGQDAVELRERQRAEWSAAAPAWQPDPTTPVAAPDPVTQRLLALARVAPDQRVLDLACGGGNPAFAIAAWVGDGGQVLGLDLSPEMIEGTSTRAQRQGIRNAEFRVLADESDLGVPTGHFDAATCRFGLMFMPDPGLTLRMLNKALKPGARVAASTWAGMERCPSYAVLVAIVRRHVDLSPVALTELTRPFSALGERRQLEVLLTAAGFGELEIDLVDGASEAESAAAYWDAQSARAAPLRGLLAALPDERRTAIRADAVATLGAMFPGGPVRLLNQAWVAAGIKPA